ncbi:MAG: N-(5'-phosphoribosyl)anthranilate isomerase [Candidatus Zixiibacteriota bacterium]|nr:MAG: N-(5'-phosphoribosyl)anthranilate isomerase [candidate division Zixibacteria bacterium]
MSINSKLKIKICGIKRLKDAKKAFELGADFLGFIFYKPSPRNIIQSEAKKILAILPSTISKVAVFVDEDIEKVIKIAKQLKFDYVQLHGQESSAYINAIKRERIKVIKSFPLKLKIDLKEIMNCKADLVLVDNISADLRGGSGKKFNWDIRIPVAVDNLVLSGGLNKYNIIEGIKKFKPLVVDINSGVESKPGMKSGEKLKEIFKQINKLRCNGKLS